MAIGELTDIFHWVLKRACNPIECFVLSRRTFSASFNSTWSYVQVKEISNLLKRWTCVMAWYFDVISDSFWLSFVFFVIIVVVFFLWLFCSLCVTADFHKPVHFLYLPNRANCFSHCEVFWTLSELDNPVTSETWIESKLKLFLILYFISSK